MNTINENSINFSEIQVQELKILTWEQRNALIQEKLKRAIDYVTLKKQQEKNVDSDII